MSPDEVMSLYPKAVRTQEDGAPSPIIAFDGEVAGLTGMTVFAFVKDKLAVAGVIFPPGNRTMNERMRDYSELKSALTKKYGKPLSDETVWFKRTMFDTPDRLASSIEMGNAALVASWQTPETEIELSMEGKNYSCQIKIRYASRTLAQAFKDDQQQAKANGL